MLQVYKTNNNSALDNIKGLKEEYINIYKNVYCKDDSGRALSNNNNCKTKKQLNKLNNYFKNENRNGNENNNEIENNNPYNNEKFLQKIKKYKQLGLRINNSSKVKVYSSIFHKKLNKFTIQHKTKLLKLECLLKNVKNKLFDLKMAETSSKQLLAYKKNNNNNKNFTNLKKFKNNHTQYKQQTKNQRKQKLSKFFSKINPFGKKLGSNQTTQESETTITYNKKKHTNKKKIIYNKLRDKTLNKFLEDINQLFTNNN